MFTFIFRLVCAAASPLRSALGFVLLLGTVGCWMSMLYVVYLADSRMVRGSWIGGMSEHNTTRRENRLRVDLLFGCAGGFGTAGGWNGGGVSCFGVWRWMV